MKLIYHKNSDSISEFDINITNICTDNNVNIVCPYIGLNYFKRIVNRTTDWKLITDIEEWILSHVPNERENIKEFIVSNISRIHHCKDIHAKVIFNNKNALVGSANFTNMGITKRIEMSVFIDDEVSINEINIWFSELWESTDSPIVKELDFFVQSVKGLSQLTLNETHHLNKNYPLIKKELQKIKGIDESNQNEFEINKFYTRPQISKILGGDAQSYLPHKNWKVTCCCIKGELNLSNEETPIILVGDAPNVIKSGEMLIKQKEIIPIFVKKAPNQHRYIGMFKVKRFTKNASEIKAIKDKVKRLDVPVMAIFMEKVSD